NPARLTVLGLRAGLVNDRSLANDSAIQGGLTPDVDRAVETLVRVAGRERAELGSLDVEGGTVFFGAQRRGGGRGVWATYTVSAPKFLSTWRATVIVLSSAAVLLGAIALIAVVGSTRGARALKRALAALENDLSADIPHPALAELATVADGVASLAR